LTFQRRRVGALRAPAVHHPKAAAVGQHFSTHLLLRSHPRPHDVGPALLLQIGERLLADHAPIGHHADPPNLEPPPQTIHNGDESSYVGRVPRPHFAADRPALAIQHRAHHQLLLGGPMIFAMPVLPERVAALAFEIDRGGVEKNDVQVGEQVAPPLKELLLDQVLGAARRELGRVVQVAVGQHFAEPGHGPVEVVQFQAARLGDGVVFFPFVGGAIAAGLQQAVQHREEEGSFDREFETPFAQKRCQDRPAAALFPEPLEDQDRTQAPAARRRQASLGVLRQDQELVGEAGPGVEQAVDGAALLEIVESSQGGEDALARSAVLPVVFDDLEIGAWAGLLGAEEHGCLALWALGV
jgi:hypothetical protein